MNKAVIKIIILYFSFMIAYQAIIDTLFKKSSDLLKLSMESLFMIIVIYILLYLLKKSGLKLKLIKKEIFSFKQIIIIITSISIIIIMNLWLSNQLNVNLFQNVRSNSIIIVLISIVLVGFITPFVEELVARVLFIDYLFKKRKLGLLVSIIIFFILHVPSTIPEVVFYLSSSVILSLVYYYTQRFEIVLIIHVFNNLFSLLVL